MQRTARELAAALTNEGGTWGSWLERFGIEVVGVAISAIEYDQASRELMDKYNKGTLLGGAVGNAYAQATVADSALAMGESGAGGDGLIGLAMGLGVDRRDSVGNDAADDCHGHRAAGAADPVVVLGQLKAMLDQGLITAEQYAAKQQEILNRM